jgi:hypothetical protein
MDRLHPGRDGCFGCGFQRSFEICGTCLCDCLPFRLTFGGTAVARSPLGRYFAEGRRQLAVRDEDPPIAARLQRAVVWNVDSRFLPCRDKRFLPCRAHGGGVALSVAWWKILRGRVLPVPRSVMGFGDTLSKGWPAVWTSMAWSLSARASPRPRASVKVLSGEVSLSTKSRRAGGDEPRVGLRD